MKILHVTAYCSAFSVGGTEIYIDGLVGGLNRKYGIENRVLAITPQVKDKGTSEIVALYPNSRNQVDMATFQEKCRVVLEEFKPDWIIIHTSDVMEVVVAALAVEKGIPYVFLYHALYWLCAHYDMRHCGKETCHRLFSPWRCSICMASGKSKSVVRGVIGALAGEFQRCIRPFRNSWLNSFRYELPRKEYILRNASKVIALNEHDKAIMLENGIDESRIAVIPQGVSEEQVPQFRINAATKRTGCLKVGYVGRATRIKGCHLLVEAMRLLPSDAAMELHIYGCDEKSEYVWYLHQLAEDDRRIILHSMMPAAEVLKEYAKLDVVCIPSIVFETGPLTLFEAIYSGCRVYGSMQIGQMAMLLRYGRLVDGKTREAWAEVFKECLEDVDEIRTNRCQEFACRTMSLVAEELMRCLL